MVPSSERLLSKQVWARWALICECENVGETQLIVANDRKDALMTQSNVVPTNYSYERGGMNKWLREKKNYLGTQG